MEGFPSKAKRIVLNRFGQASEVATVVAFLPSDAVSGITSPNTLVDRRLTLGAVLPSSIPSALLSWPLEMAAALNLRPAT